MADESTEEEGYLVCDEEEDYCCEIDSAVMTRLEWKFGAKQFFRCILSYFLGENEEDYNMCRKIVGDEFWAALQEHVDEACNF